MSVCSGKTLRHIKKLIRFLKNCLSASVCAHLYPCALWWPEVSATGLPQITPRFIFKNRSFTEPRLADLARLASQWASGMLPLMPLQWLTLQSGARNQTQVNTLVSWGLSKQSHPLSLLFYFCRYRIKPLTLCILNTCLTSKLYPSPNCILVEMLTQQASRPSGQASTSGSNNGKGQTWCAWADFLSASCCLWTCPGICACRPHFLYHQTMFRSQLLRTEFRTLVRLSGRLWGEFFLIFVLWPNKGYFNNARKEVGEETLPVNLAFGFVSPGFRKSLAT